MFAKWVGSLKRKWKKTAALKEMVQEAIKALKEPRGSSLYEINKYVAANYTVDCDKLSDAIKKYLKTTVALREMAKMMGKGALCSIRLAADPARSQRAAFTDQREQKNHLAKTKASWPQKLLYSYTKEQKADIYSQPKNCPSNAKKTPKKKSLKH